MTVTDYPNIFINIGDVHMKKENYADALQSYE
jgi:hypothetical protein